MLQNVQRLLLQLPFTNNSNEEAMSSFKAKKGVNLQNLYDTSNNAMATNLRRSTPQPTDSSPNTIHALFHFFGQVEEPHPRYAPSLVMNQRLYEGKPTAPSFFRCSVIFPRPLFLYGNSSLQRRLHTSPVRLG